MKYIRFEDEFGRPEFVLFSSSILHVRIADALRSLLGNPISAGHVTQVRGCHGESETLRIKALPEDTELLVRTMKLGEQQ